MMQQSGRFQQSLQENLITLLAHNESAGRVVANLVPSHMFEGDYRVVAERCIEYWNAHKVAPGYHLSDLFADILEDSHNRKAPTYRSIITNSIELSHHINAEYVLDTAIKFLRVQEIKSVLMTSAERLQAQQELAIGDVEEMLNALMRARSFAFDAGNDLTEYEVVLSHLAQSQQEFKIGVRELDQAGIVPARGTLMLLMGALGQGKTWGIIHIVKNSLLQRKKVVHLSLEMRQPQILMRYYQSIWGIPKRVMDRIDVRRIELDRHGQFKSIDDVKIDLAFSLASEYARDELEQHVEWIRGQLQNVKVKFFSPNSLTVNGLYAYLDNLEATEGFIPDLICIDAPYLMKIPTRDYRLNLGRTIVEIRGVSAERNVAIVATHQMSKAGSLTRRPGMQHLAEDWSIGQTCDTVLIFARTEAEGKHGLARVYVGKARDEEGNFGVLLTQNYNIGQWAITSTRLTDPVYQQLEKEEKKDAEKPSKNEDEDETEEADDSDDEE